MGRYALLIGVSNYTDLNPLPSAVKDVAALKEVLIDPKIGGFADSDVEALTDVDETAIRRGISKLFANRKNDDLVLLYFSGHGVTDSRNDFYLSGISTDKNDLLSTAVSSDFVQKAMNQRGSKRQVLILDCCHSGAFPKGMTAKDIGKVNLSPKLGGEGRAILTASDSTQYAFEQEGFELSLYTHFLVEGLRTGAADRDDDGAVTVDELYEYVRDKVKSVNDLMSPEVYAVKEGYRIVLANAVQDDPKLKFRKEITEIIDLRKGKILPTTRQLITNAQVKHKVDNNVAQEIEKELLKPYLEYENNLKAYKNILRDTITHEFPFSEVTQLEIEKCEIGFGLRPEDIEKAKKDIIAPKQSEYDREQAELAIRAKNLQTSRQRPIIQKEETISSLSQPEFEFEVVKVRLVKESGFLGIGGVKVELDRKKGKAQYIRESLGNGVTLDLVRIPAGKFMMGMSADERKIALENAKKYNSSNAETWLDWSTPQHEVKVPSFLMGKYAVTNAQWKAIMGTKPSEKSDVKFQGENQPVINVSWDNAKEFCKKLSEKIEKNVRLPSEAEWEYACRAGTTTAFHFGETITPELVNYDGNYPYVDAPKGEYREKTVDVNFDKFSPNAWGLYQLHGNVWEWCEDVWHDNYNGAPTDGSAWLTGGEQNRHIVRGGSWISHAIYCRSASRLRFVTVSRNFNLGFRVVL
jgi:formylglycine-generating enzyme required for sulfatase activity